MHNKPLENRKVTREDLFRNTLFNLAGNAIPLITAFLTIPFLLQRLGAEKFGILSLGWALIGYFGLADLGISRALTKLVSEKNNKETRDELPSLIWTALSIIVIVGLVGGLLLAFLSPVLVRSVLKIKSINSKDILNSFLVLSFAVPFTVAGSGLRAILEALMRFDLSNYVRTALGVLSFIGPAIILIFSNNILWVMVVLAISRVVCMLVYLKLCFNTIPEMKVKVVLNKSKIVHLLKFGGWITVSNLISPMMVSFDRFFIGAIISIGAIAYYSTPWEVVTKLLIIPSSFACVLFPMFSQSKKEEKLRESDLFYRVQKYILLVMFPFCLMSIAFAKEILTFWLGSDFANNSYRVMQIMTIAVLFNGLASIPFALIQAGGRPDITAKYHIIELFIYMPILWLFIHKLNILGAALAWLVRAALDFYLLLRYVKKPTRNVAYSRSKVKTIPIEYQLGLTITILIIPILINDILFKIILAIFVLIAFIIISWTILLDRDEKKHISKKLGWTSN